MIPLSQEQAREIDNGLRAQLEAAPLPVPTLLAASISGEGAWYLHPDGQWLAWVVISAPHAPLCQLVTNSEGRWWFGMLDPWYPKPPEPLRDGYHALTWLAEQRMHRAEQMRALDAAQAAGVPFEQAKKSLLDDIYAAKKKSGD